MKQITNKEYEAYQQYQSDRLHGRILTPDGLRVICAGLDNDPESNHYAPRNIRRDVHTVQECMLNLLQSVKQKKRMKFEDAFRDAPTKEAVVTYFLAVLELLKLGQMHIRQNSVYGEIELIYGKYKPKKETDLTTVAGKDAGT